MNSESILLIGSNGQVGKELQLTLEYELQALARPEADLNRPEDLCRLIEEDKPEILINAAAYTAVDKAETEPELANAINATAVEAIATTAAKIGAYLIHLSTDYVFDGNASRPYLETDATNPLSTYGQSKLAGEQVIPKICDRYLILRTAWVYGSFGKSNFVLTMLRLGKEREEVRVVSDQIGSPTWTKDIALTIEKLIPQKSLVNGIYHYTSSGVASWYDFAVAIFEEARQLDYPLKVQRVVPIATSEYPTAANRPSYSVLETSKISALLQLHPPHWRQSLRKMLREYRDCF